MQNKKKINLLLSWLGNYDHCIGCDKYELNNYKLLFMIKNNSERSLFIYISNDINLI